MESCGLSIVCFLLVGTLSTAQDPFDRSFRRQPNSRSNRPSFDAQRQTNRGPPPRPPEFSFADQQGGQSDRQVDVVPLERGPFDRRRPGSFTQGQLETTNQAQLDAGGQGEMLMQGEIQVPTAMLNAARQTRGDSSRQGGFDNTRHDSLGGRQGQTVDGTHSGQFDSPPPVTFGDSRRDPPRRGSRQGGSRRQQFDRSRNTPRDRPQQDRLRVSDQQPSERGQNPDGGFASEQRGSFGRGMLQTSNQASNQLDASGMMDLGVDIQIETPSQQLNPSRSGTFDSPASGGRDIPRDRAGQRQFESPRDGRRLDSATGQGQTDIPRPARFDFPQDRFDTSRQGTFDTPRDGQRQFGDTRQGAFDQSRNGRFDSLRQRQTDASRQGQFDGSNQRFDSQGSPFDASQTGPPDASRHGPFDGPRQRPFDQLTDGRFDSSRQGQFDGPRQPSRSRDGRLDASQPDQFDSFPQGQFDGSLQGSRDGPFDFPRSGSRDVPNPGRFDGSRQSSATPDGRFDTSGQRRLEPLPAQQGGIGTSSGPGSGNLDPQPQEIIDSFPQGRFERPRDRRPDASSQGRFDASQPGGDFGNFRPGNRGSLTQGQVAATDQAHLDASGQGEVLIEGELQIPTQLLNAVRQGLSGALGGASQGPSDNSRQGPLDSTGPGNSVGSQGQSNPDGTQRGGSSSSNIDGAGQGASNPSRQTDSTRQGRNDRQGQSNPGFGPGSFGPSGQGSTGSQQGVFNPSGQTDGAVQGGINRHGQGNLGSGPDSFGPSGQADRRSQQRGFDPSGLPGNDASRGRGPDAAGQGNMDAPGQSGLDPAPQDGFAEGARQGNNSGGNASRGQSEKYGTVKVPLTSLLSVNIRCYADPIKGLSCGVEYPDDRCKEKWDFPDPCTRENMDKSITKFVHPYDHSKFLMCGEMGKLYIVQCPQHEIFHAVCGQCVHKTMELTTSCQEPLTPQVANPCTEQNIIENKLYFPYPGNLAKYIHCDNWGKAWARVCTPGNVWNKWDKACVIPTILNPCSRLNADLAYIYPHPCNPRRYLRCDNYGDAYEEYCDAGKAFNEAKQDCDLIGSFIGSDQPEFCENRIFGFKPGRPRGGIDRGLGQDKGRLDRIGSTGQRPGSVGVNGKAGSLVLHESKARTYKFIENTPYVEPCTAQNIKEGRYHFRVEGDPYSYIQCDQSGKSYLMPCPGDRTDSFDPWTNTCVDGLVHVDNIING